MLSALWCSQYVNRSTASMKENIHLPTQLCWSKMRGPWQDRSVRSLKKGTKTYNAICKAYYNFSNLETTSLVLTHSIHASLPFPSCKS